MKKILVLFPVFVQILKSIPTVTRLIRDYVFIIYSSLFLESLLKKMLIRCSSSVTGLSISLIMTIMTIICDNHVRHCPVSISFLSIKALSVIPSSVCMFQRIANQFQSCRIQN